MRNPPRVCAIIPARNVGGSIANVMNQLVRAKVTHCIPVANGCSDDTLLNARLAAEHLPLISQPVHFSAPLGPDVPRAIGAYQALRSFHDIEWFLFVDGDWSGGFGPTLEDFIAFARQQRRDVQFAPRQSDNDLFNEIRVDYQVWDAGLMSWDKATRQASASEVPLMVHRRTFRQISPYYLYHPGLWFALVLEASRHGLRCGVSETWFSRLAGNPSPSQNHAKAMRETLIGDALEGARVLLNQKPHRFWKGMLYDGYNSTRRVDVLKKWQSQTSH